jgi:hypothetical protein
MAGITTAGSRTILARSLAGGGRRPQLIDDAPEEFLDHGALGVAKGRKGGVDGLGLPTVGTLDLPQRGWPQANLDDPSVVGLSLPLHVACELQLLDHPARPAARDPETPAQLTDRELAVLVEMDCRPDRVRRHVRVRRPETYRGSAAPRRIAAVEELDDQLACLEGLVAETSRSMALGG